MSKVNLIDNKDFLSEEDLIELSNIPHDYNKVSQELIGLESIVEADILKCQGYIERIDNAFLNMENNDITPEQLMDKIGLENLAFNNMLDNMGMSNLKVTTDYETFDEIKNIGLEARANIVEIGIGSISRFMDKFALLGEEIGTRINKIMGPNSKKIAEKLEDIESFIKTNKIDTKKKIISGKAMAEFAATYYKLNMINIKRSNKLSKVLEEVFQLPVTDKYDSSTGEVKIETKNAKITGKVKSKYREHYFIFSNYCNTSSEVKLYDKNFSSAGTALLFTHDELMEYNDFPDTIQDMVEIIKDYGDADKLGNYFMRLKTTNTKEIDKIVQQIKKDLSNSKELDDEVVKNMKASIYVLKNLINFQKSMLLAGVNSITSYVRMINAITKITINQLKDDE